MKKDEQVTDYTKKLLTVRLLLFAQKIHRESLPKMRTPEHGYKGSLDYNNNEVHPARMHLKQNKRSGNAFCILWKRVSLSPCLDSGTYADSRVTLHMLVKHLDEVYKSGRQQKQHYAVFHPDTQYTDG